MKRLPLLFVLALSALSLLVACGPQAVEPGKEESPMSKKRWSSPPEMQIDPEQIYVATMETDRGTIVLELYPQHAPKTVNNFVFLAREGFYDGLTFHRVISDFMIQGGDPTGSGSGGPGYKFEDEVKDNPLTHETGVISMANAGPNTNGSQFFITHSPQPHLNGNHTVFGKVMQGQDVVDATRQGDRMITVTITEK
jgi:peptidyl-prolyl cis-trans isomerase B (cyclophilin B)